jgi:translation initiation factor 3 subunit C
LRETPSRHNLRLIVLPVSLTEFDKLVRLVSRQANVAEAIPTGFVKALISLDDTLAAAQGAKKKMNATNAKALNSMKQKLKKTQRENEEIIKKYKEVGCLRWACGKRGEARKLTLLLCLCALRSQDPEAFEKAALAEETPVAAPKKGPKKTGPLVVDAEDEDFQTVGNKGKTIAISSEGIYKALAQVLEARGRKVGFVFGLLACGKIADPTSLSQNTDRSEQIKILEKLLTVAVTPYQKIRVLLALISALLDYNPSTNTHMPVESWTSARSHLDLLLDILTEDRQYVVQEQAGDYDDSVERAPTGSEPTIIVRGSVISLVDRLDDEFTKSLQNIDPHTGEYIDRLKDEKKIYETIVKAQIYFEQVKLAEHLDRVVMRRLEHIYCKVRPCCRRFAFVNPPVLTSLPVSAA